MKLLRPPLPATIDLLVGPFALESHAHVVRLIGQRLANGSAALDGLRGYPFCVE